MSSPYRDSLEAQRSRLEALSRQINELEDSFSEFFWSDVAPTLDLEPPAELESPSRADDAEELARAVSSQESRLGSLQRVVSDYHLIEEAWRKPMPKVPPCQLKQRAHLQTFVTNVFSENPHLAAFEKLVAELGATDKPSEAGPYGRRAAITFQGVPFQLLCDCYVTNQQKTWQADLSVQTAVSLLSGELQLTPQGFGSELLIAIRLRQDIKVGSYEFDGTFVIRGEEAAAQTLLTSAIRSSLLEIAKVDIPTLVVSKGLARLTWSFEPTRRCLESAMLALKGIREAPATKSLKR